MERLNDIINRTAQRRQQSGDQQEPRVQRGQLGQQGQRTNQAQRPAQPLARRPLPEQTARLGQQGQQGPPTRQLQSQPAQPMPPTSPVSPAPPTRKYYQHTPRNRALPEPDYSQHSRNTQREIREPYAQYTPYAPGEANVTRQLYGYEPTARRNESAADNTGSTGYDHTPRRIVQATPPADDYYDAYPATMPPADVQEEWEDDAAVMRYGDWEDDSYNNGQNSNNTIQHSYQPQRSNRGNDPGVVPATNYPDQQHYANYSSAPREMPPTQRRDREIREIELHPRGVPYSSVTRNLQTMQTQVPPSRLSVSPVSPITPIPSTTPPALPSPQEMRSHRHTQPLDPQTVVNMTREMPQERAERVRQPQPARIHDGQVQTTSIANPSPSTRNVCPVCKGAGYLRANVPVGEPNFGKPVPCACKEAEWREKRRQQLLELSDLSAFQQRNFGNFKTQFPGVHPAVKRAFEESHIFAQDPNGWLVLVGPNGCGKTHLAAAIANQRLKEGSVVLFTVVPELLAHLRSTFSSNATEAYDQRFAKMREAELLVLDDLGAHQSSPWASEKLFQLLNYRYNSGFPTVITANRQGLMGLDERIVSRMSDTALAITVEMSGAVDYRRQNPRHEPRR